MDRNAELFARAERLIPGGVNSPVRAFRSVGGTPVFAARAKGQYLWDENGKRYGRNLYSIYFAGEDEIQSGIYRILQCFGRFKDHGRYSSGSD